MELTNKVPAYEQADLARVWGSPKPFFKVFISHRDTEKVEAAGIKESLRSLGIAAFVAHEDISPTEEWQKEILIALQSMDVLLAFICENFFKSVWTNQEVGFALGRHAPILPFKKEGNNPQGFISIIQAKKYKSESFIDDFMTMVLNLRPCPKKLREDFWEAIIEHFTEAPSFAAAYTRFKPLERATDLEASQIQKIVDAFNTNGQIRECFDLNGYNMRGEKRNNGLICKKLFEWTGDKYEIIQDSNLKLVLRKA